MAWIEVEKMTKTAAKNNGVIVGVTKKGRFKQRLVVTVRTDLIENPPLFWKLGAFVTVQIGAGEHAGLLRILPDGHHKVTRLGRIKAGVATLMFPLPDFIKTPGEEMTPVDFCSTEDWLEIILPNWAKPKAVIPQPVVPIASAAPPAVPVRTGTPYRTAATIGKGPMPVNGGR